MIRKFGGVDASPEETLRVLLDIESWPEWMPNIRATRILERTENRILADVTRAEFGAVHNTRLEFLIGAGGYLERQVKGLARKWEGDWRIVAAPGGRGSVVSCKLDVDLGLYGFLMPGRLVQRTVDQSFEKIMRGVSRRSRQPEKMVEAPTESRSPLEGVECIQVFATPTGLEVWLDGRKYTARPAD